MKQPKYWQQVYQIEEAMLDLPISTSTMERQLYEETGEIPSNLGSTVLTHTC